MFSIKENTVNEIVINKSRFITKLIKISNEEEIKDILKAIKNQYKGATHYCYAYIINNIKRLNDDNEPNNTAGLPILQVLEKNNLNFILCVVIRYFGGTKLGVGGLVRAYTKSVTDCLKKANIIELTDGYLIKITFDYDYTKEINYFLNNYRIKKKDFNEKINYIIKITTDDYKDLVSHLKPFILEVSIIEKILIEK